MGAGQDLHPVYTMINTEVWDDPCRKMLDDTLADSRTLDGFTLMFFGAHFTTDTATIAKMCDYEAYIERARARLDSAEASKIHETVRVALRKAVGSGW